MITEADLKAAQSGDSEAFTKIYNETVKTAYYVAKRILVDADSDAVEDVLQEAYVAVYKHLGDYKAGNFQGWVDTIVANRAKNYLRKKNPILFTEMETEENPVVEFEDEKIEFRPDDNVDYSETKRLVMEIVDGLSAEQRLATILFYFEERSVKEIAEICECSENTIKSRLNYARKKIKEDVLALEKKGTKLYSISAIPFLIWLLSEEAKACVVSEATSATILTGIQSATGCVVETVAGEVGKEAVKTVAKEVAGEAGKEVAKTVAVEAAKATTASVVKTAAVKTGMALGTKIALGLTVATVTVGGVAGATAVVQNYEEWFDEDDDDEDDNDDRNHESEGNIVDITEDSETQEQESQKIYVTYRLKRMLKYSSEENYQNGDISETITYFYKEDGISYVAECESSSGYKSEYEAHIFDEEGRLIETRDWNENCYYYYYDEQGVLYKSEYAYGDIPPVPTLYEYDDNGYLVKETIYGYGDDVATEVKTYINDEDGKPIQAKSDCSGEDVDSHYRYTYDGAGNLLKMKRTFESGGSRQEVFEYDNAGNKIKREWYDTDELNIRETMEYDNHGNLISKRLAYIDDGVISSMYVSIYEYEEVLTTKHVHNYTAVQTKEPTCEADGQGEVTYTCSCGDTYTKETDRIDHCTDDIKIIQEATCSQMGIKTYSCIFCGREFEREDIPMKAHKESDWIVVIEATATSEGLKHKVCTVCGEELESEIIPSTGN